MVPRHDRQQTRTRPHGWLRAFSGWGHLWVLMTLTWWMVLSPARWLDDFGSRLSWWWRRQGGHGPAEQQPHPASELSQHQDPWPLLLQWFSRAPGMKGRLLVGADQGGLIFSEPEQHVLALAPTRANKTAGVLIPQFLTFFGAGLNVTSKMDIFNNTAMTRSRLGPIFFFAFDGRECPAGAIPVRWSPVTSDWKLAKELARVMVGAVEANERSRGGSSIWSRLAGVLIGPVLFAAGVGGKSLAWVVEAIVGQDFDKLQEAANILEEAGPDGSLALASLNSVMRAHEDGRKSVFLSAADALAPYTDPSVLAAAENPDFDPADFVAGDPEAWNPDLWTEHDRQMSAHAHVPTVSRAMPRGRYGTVYIVSESEDAAPIIVAFLHAIRRAAYAQREADDAAGYHGRGGVLWSLDELGLCPLHDLFQMLSQSASRGILVAAAVQDLSLIESKWSREAADGSLTLFQHAVVFRGCRHGRTLETISTFLGKTWITLDTISQGFNTGSGGGKNWSEGESHHLVPVLDPGEISAGHPEDPDLVLGIGPNGWGWHYPMPYYVGPPWPALLVGTMLHLALHAGPDDPRCQLPVPDLDRDGTGQLLLAQPNGEFWLEAFRASRPFFEDLVGRVVRDPATPPASQPPQALEFVFTAQDSPEEIERTIAAAFEALEQAQTNEPTSNPDDNEE